MSSLAVALSPARAKPCPMERIRRGKALLLIAPLFLFLAVTFLLPLGGMLKLAVDDREVATLLPRTFEALQGWDGKALPAPEAFAALAADLDRARQDRTVGTIGRRLNYDLPGMRNLITSTARKALPAEPVDWQAYMIGLDRAWAETATWASIARARGPATSLYLLTALDLTRDDSGHVVPVAEGQSNYLGIFARTLGIALAVTLICLVLAFPVAQLIASASPTLAASVMLLVLLPFWTSVLVRTTAWVVILQGDGLANRLLLNLGLISEPLHMLYNRTGVLIALSHVLLPYMILPLCSAMRAVPPSQMRAAASLGAGPAYAWLRVYLPQLLPGIAAGSLLVFILALGYYITPVLIGSPNDQLISYYIAFYTSGTINWGLAAALGMILLTATLLLYRLYVGLVGAQRIGR